MKKFVVFGFFSVIFMNPHLFSNDVTAAGFLKKEVVSPMREVHLVGTIMTHDGCRIDFDVWATINDETNTVTNLYNGTISFSGNPPCPTGTFTFARVGLGGSYETDLGIAVSSDENCEIEVLQWYGDEGSYIVDFLNRTDVKEAFGNKLSSLCSEE